MDWIDVPNKWTVWEEVLSYVQFGERDVVVAKMRIDSRWSAVVGAYYLADLFWLAPAKEDPPVYCYHPSRVHRQART
jgi:hypothetical protein